MSLLDIVSPMKTSARLLPPACVLLLAVLSTVAPAFGGNMSALVVSVKKPGGAPAFTSRTDANGNFTTGNLAPGSYMVEVRSQKAAEMKGKMFSVVIAGGKHQVKQAGIPGEKFAGGGVGMSVEVAKSGSLRGQVSTSAQTVAAAEQSNVKIINGKRHVWVRGEIGSNLGGKWVLEEEATVPGQVRRGDASESLRKMQDLGGQGAASGR